ncbi:Cytochrome P450 [Corchorus capsularis]|uniref:Cytochrome P450 n=1 Tax=Corchorus capsularis TaxID=210143 RepID=A0A1R3HV70_COCAP|nr:Cytochrome P450 [Corchorus capsularis]
MTPTLLLHLHRALDKMSELLEKNNGTLQYKGIWFTNTSFLATADPQNVFYLMNTNYAAYPKGSEWRKQFDVFGEALFNSDGEEWKRQRRIFHAFLNHPKFHQSLSRILRQRLEHGLIEVLDHVSKQELVIDLQDLIVRYASDIGWKLATGSDPNFLSIDFPENKFNEAMNDVLEAAFYRAILPDSLWKLQSWLQVGLEKKRSHAWKYFDRVLAEQISIQRQKASEAVAMDGDHEDNFNFLNCYLTGHKVTGPTPKDSLIRDNVIHMLFATDDTYSTSLGWFFYLLSQNPKFVPKIREEIERNLTMKKAGEFQVPASFDELNKLPYLQAALCETLRLYPPNPFEFRTATQRDTLPSGHRVNPQSVIIIAIHAMGKMTRLWGEDCHEFKPERWITKEGKLKQNDGLPRNYPIIGMTPTLLLNFHRAHEKVAEVLNRSNGTFHYKGIWFTNSSFLATCHPDNVRHITTTNSLTYLKGSEWLKQFDIFGESLFNSDGEAWKRHRKAFHAFVNHKKFHQSVAKLILNRIEQGLVKVFEHVSKQGLEVNLQDLFKRHAFDIACKLATGYDSQLLSLEFPENRFHNAMSDAWEAAFYRYILPDAIWKLQSWLRIGKEKKRRKAWKALDDLLAEFISIQRGEIERNKAMKSSQEDDDENFNFLKCYLTGHEVTGPTPSDSLIRDNLIHFMLATDDTNSTVLTWLFYHLSKNPDVEIKIREELKKNLSFKQVGENLQLPSCLIDDLNQLVYLHAALCEALRLSPPVPFEFRAATQDDVLPSGHRVRQGTRLLMGIHAMGRMPWLWGEDCHEFKPERWITDEGKIKREVPSKSLAFLAGPRICVGKNLAFFIMKATTATILHNYNVHVIEGQNVTPKHSVIFHMQHGLKVKKIPIIKQALPQSLAPELRGLTTRRTTQQREEEKNPEREEKISKLVNLIAKNSDSD